MKVWRGRMRRQLERAFMAMPGRHRAADACLFGAAAGGHYAAYRLSPRSRPGRARGLRRDGDARQRERPLHLPPRSGRPVASGHPHRSDLDVQQMCRRLDLPGGPGRAGGALESEIARLQGENASLKQMIACGEPAPEGKTAHRPYHSYTMKQAIQEGFIVDVLRNYTPVTSYYKLVKTVEADPEFDTKRAKKKLRRYVESHQHAIGLKAEPLANSFLRRISSVLRKCL
jgi:hypothetical protein